MHLFVPATCRFRSCIFHDPIHPRSALRLRYTARFRAHDGPSSESLLPTIPATSVTLTGLRTFASGPSPPRDGPFLCAAGESAEFDSQPTTSARWCNWQTRDAQNVVLLASLGVQVSPWPLNRSRANPSSRRDRSLLTVSASSKRHANAKPHQPPGASPMANLVTGECRVSIEDPS